MFTLSELTGGLAVEASIPSNLRWLPKEMTVNYTKKAAGNSNLNKGEYMPLPYGHV
jgi:hypothetical protein